MRLMKCCFCLPLRVGVIITGCMFGSFDTIVGSIGWYMVAINSFPESVHEFFDELDVRFWVGAFSFTFYCMALNDLMLIYGAARRKPGYMGPWLLINFMVGICTIVTALLSPFAICRIIVLYYCMFVVSSFYDELTEDDDEE